MARSDIARKLVGDIVTAAERAGADALVTDCPMCQANVEIVSQLDLDGRATICRYFLQLSWSGGDERRLSHQAAESAPGIS